MKHTLITVFSVVIIWELAITSEYVPSMSKIIITFFDLLTNTDFLFGLWTSIQRLSIGWTTGMILGTFLGFVMGINYHVRKLLLPLVGIIFPIPKIALLPLFVVLLGLGETSKIITIFIGSFFPSVFVAYNSVLRTPKELIEVAQSFGSNNWMILRRVIFPYNLPSIIHGFKTSGNLALTLLVASEMLGAKYGLGYWIFITGGQMEFAEMFAGVIWLSIIGLCINHGTDYLKNKLCYWSTLSEGASFR